MDTRAKATVAKEAARRMLASTDAQRQAALHAIADSLDAARDAILAANQKDLDAAAELDAILARARLGRAWDGVVPQVHGHGRVHVHVQTRLA